MMNGHRLLITGATGFVGAHIARRALAQGAEVHALVRSTSNLWRLADIAERLTLHTCDLADADGLRRVTESVRPTLIYHLGVLGAYPFQTDAEAIIRTNILGTWNLLKACSDIDYTVFVNAGSSSEYGSKDAAMRESDVLEPNSYYAVSKAAQSLLCQHVARSEQRPICTLRLFSVYGYYEEPSRLIPTLIRRCLAGEALTMADPETARDYVFVDDVADAFLQTERLARASGKIINIGTGVQHTLADIVAIITRLTESDVPVHWNAMPPRIWDSFTWVADITQSRQALGWRPKTSLEDGLRQTVAWFKRAYGAAEPKP